MVISSIDWIIIGFVMLVSLIIGLLVMKRAGKNPDEYFAGGKNLPWWLLGISMVATTFSTDTPNLVTDIVREHGVSGNWIWFAFLLTGMLTVYVYARLWKRSGVLTDIEFYELRYSGKSAAFLRGFRALYLGIVFNVIIMATVTLAAIKIGSILMGLQPWETIVFSGIVIIIYSSLGGLRGVLLTDFFQFFLAMFGSFYLMFYSVNKAGGLKAVVTNENVVNKLSLLPDFSDTGTLVAIFIVPLAVQWWSVWYPGAEPGGGGYIAQRMFAAKDEKNALNATLLFNIAHYAIRPWPWILTALASLVIFPDLVSIGKVFPHIDPSILKNDIAYPAMIYYLPKGVLGIVLASLIAAYMSTISTQLNLGSSYIVNDFYKRFINKKASDKRLVLVGKGSTIVLMVIAGFVALFLENALQAFNIILQIGAGTGLLFLLRWFWWRINAISEIAAMISSLVIAIYFEFIHSRLGYSQPETWIKLIIGVFITTIVWVTVTLFTKPSDRKTLLEFCRKIKPGNRGWYGFYKQLSSDERRDTKGDKTGENFSGKIANIFFGTLSVYSFLFSVGFFLEDKILFLVISLLLFITSTFFLVKKQKSA
ncbi:MAG: sodium:solute symporter family protein [Acidobacteriota bacterium]